jgi:uncharacterized protein YnzC (UPF0291/DUF896 family)
LPCLFFSKDLNYCFLISSFQEIGRKHPNCGFGGMFYKWVFSKRPEPYNSFGNGAAMRVSPAGFAGISESETIDLAETVTAITHDHGEGIKGATATVVAIFLARQGATKAEIRERISRDYYSLDFKIDDIRPTYKFNETCQETVPQAIECFLESISFEDAIRTAISLGGDSDTIGAITGAIAEAYYGVPEEIKEQALSYLDEELRAIYDEWVFFAPPHNEQFRVLTKYVGLLSARVMIGGDIAPHMDYFPFDEFETEWIHSNFPDTSYGDALAEMGIELSFEQINNKEVDDLNAKKVLSLITAAFRHDHFSNGVLIEYFRSGAMLKWLKRLKDIDWQKRPRLIAEVELKLGGFGCYNTYRMTIVNDKAVFSMLAPNFGEAEGNTEEKENVADIRCALENMHFEYWLSSYPQKGDIRACDGEKWSLSVQYDDGTALEISGDNTYPENWNTLLEFFGIDQSNNNDDEEDETEVEFSEPPQPSVVILFPDFEKLKASVEKLRTELSMLVLERDELVFVECKNIEMAYMLTIGGLEYKAYEIECAILRLKRKAQLIQAKKNRQEKVVMSKIDELLDAEFAEYQAKLNEQVEKMNAAIERSKGKALTDEETRELKKLYRAVVKALHPDIHPDLSDAKIQLFQNAVSAYENGNLNELKIISAMVSEPALPDDKPDAISQLIKERERLTKLSQTVKDRITEIK